MGSTGDPSGESSLAPYSPVTSSRKHGAARKAGPAMHDICPARSVIYRAQYRSLVRLAVVLTGDAGAAQAGCWTPLPPSATRGLARRRKTTPCRTCGDSRWPGHVGPGITISGTAAGGPVVGGGAACCISIPDKARHLAMARLAPRTVPPSTLNTSRIRDRQSRLVSQYQPRTPAS